MIRWGILGCGAVTEQKSGPAFQQAAGSRLTAVMRRNGERAADYARRHRVPHWFDEVDALLACAEVDAVYVATPPSSHVPLALRALAAGKPVYIEKPLAANVAEAERLLAAVARTGLPAFVAYYRRGLPRFRHLKRLLQDGAIGEVYACRVEYASQRGWLPDGAPIPWRFDKATAGGGLFVDLGSHTLDILDDLLGPIRSAHGVTGQVGRPAYDVENLVAAEWVFESGVIGSGLWHFTSPFYRDEVVLTGTLGELRFSTFGDGPVVLQRPGCGEQRFEHSNPDPIQGPLVQNVVEVLLGRAADPWSTAATAVRTTRVMEAILRDDE